MPLGAPANCPTLKDRATIAAAGEYARIVEEASAGEKRRKELKTLLLTAMGSAQIVRVGNHVLRRNDVPGTPDAPDTPITKAMVGQVIAGKKGRAGYTTLEVI